VKDRLVVIILAVYRGDCMADWELLLLQPPASQERIALRVVSPGEDLNFKI